MNDNATEAPQEASDGSGHNPRAAGLILGAIGVVFGDIGTSPLYALKEAFAGASALPIDRPHILGLLSLITWSLVVVVSLKYTLLLMRSEEHTSELQSH